MFSRNKTTDGSTLQEVARVGRSAKYEYTPAGGGKPTLMIKACSHRDAESKLMMTGRMEWPDMPNPEDDIRPIAEDGSHARFGRQGADNAPSRGERPSPKLKTFGMKGKRK